MGSVKSKEDFKNLKYNIIEDTPEIINSNIAFKYENNILYCEANIKLVGTTISFEANNSLIYLSLSLYSKYFLNLIIYNDSTFFIGRDNKLCSPINIQENQNVIIGAGGSISRVVNIGTSDIHLSYYNQKKKELIMWVVF